MRGRHGKFESENFQNQVLHTQDLLLGVRVIGDVHELGNLWRIDLFVFAVYKRDPLRSNIKRRKRKRWTYEAMNMAAVPTNCNLPRKTDMCDRNRSMNETARKSVSL